MIYNTFNITFYCLQKAVVISRRARKTLSWEEGIRLAVAAKYLSIR